MQQLWKYVYTPSSQFLLATRTAKKHQPLATCCTLAYRWEGLSMKITDVDCLWVNWWCQWFLLLIFNSKTVYSHCNLVIVAPHWGTYWVCVIVALWRWHSTVKLTKKEEQRISQMKTMHHYGDLEQLPAHTHSNEMDCLPQLARTIAYLTPACVSCGQFNLETLKQL